MGNEWLSGRVGYCGAPLCAGPAGYDLLFAGVGVGDGARYLRSARAADCFRRLGYDAAVLPGIRSGDMGVLLPEGGAAARTHQLLAYYAAVLAAGAAPLAVGGDDAAACALARSCADFYEAPLCVLHIGGSLSEGLLRLTEAGCCDGSRCVELGARDGFSALHGRLRRSRLTCFSTEDLDGAPWASVGEAVRRIAGAGPAVLLFDVSFLDPAYVPSAVRPCPGGFSLEEALALLEAFLPDVDLRAAALYGFAAGPDACGLALLHTAALLGSLHRLLAAGIQKRRRAGAAP